MPISDFRDLMPDTVQIAPFLASDDHGAPGFGTAVARRARVVLRPVRLRRPDGSDTVARGQVWLADTDPVDVRDRLVLPDGATAEILAVEAPPDEAGLHHLKLYFG